MMLIDMNIHLITQWLPQVLPLKSTPFQRAICSLSSHLPYTSFSQWKALCCLSPEGRMLRAVPSTILDWQMKRRTELFLPACADAGSSVRQRQSEHAIRGGKRNHLGLSRSFCDSPIRRTIQNMDREASAGGRKERCEWKTGKEIWASQNCETLSRFQLVAVRLWLMFWALQYLFLPFFWRLPYCLDSTLKSTHAFASFQEMITQQVSIRERSSSWYPAKCIFLSLLSTAVFICNDTMIQHSISFRLCRERKRCTHDTTELTKKLEKRT